jgi:hypothetical protein
LSTGSKRIHIQLAFIALSIINQTRQIQLFGYYTIKVGTQSIPQYRTPFAAVYQHPPVSSWRERSSGSYSIPLVDPYRRPDLGLAKYNTIFTIYIIWNVNLLFPST